MARAVHYKSVTPWAVHSNSHQQQRQQCRHALWSATFSRGHPKTAPTVATYGCCMAARPMFPSTTGQVHTPGSPRQVYTRLCSLEAGYFPPSILLALSTTQQMAGFPATASQACTAGGLKPAVQAQGAKSPHGNIPNSRQATPLKCICSMQQCN